MFCKKLRSNESATVTEFLMKNVIVAFIPSSYMPDVFVSEVVSYFKL